MDKIKLIVDKTCGLKMNIMSVNIQQLNLPHFVIT